MRVAPQASDWDPFVGQLLSFLAMVTLDHNDVTFAEQADATRPDNESEYGYLHERMSGLQEHELMPVQLAETCSDLQLVCAPRLVSHPSTRLILIVCCMPPVPLFNVRGRMRSGTRSCPSASPAAGTRTACRTIYFTRP